MAIVRKRSHAIFQCAKGLSCACKSQESLTQQYYRNLALAAPGKHTSIGLPTPKSMSSIQPNTENESNEDNTAWQHEEDKCHRCFHLNAGSPGTIESILYR